ncbi:hypothetical protein DPMN_175262 [Dreissena polymorpha]|uniref:Uncharacterized protein n=1 Tax=Dreissena polymorpha TaxID=45954 RepID=A0A9D4E7X1_DREPO|nr:hypothetical protein DPMN_175262 [Dreissena polymorpha]
MINGLLPPLVFAVLPPSHPPQGLGYLYNRETNVMSSSDISCSGTSGTSGSCCSVIVFWSQRCNDFVDLLHH